MGMCGLWWRPERGCTPHLTKRFAQDNDWRVRAVVAARAGCTPHLTKRFAQDNDWRVRAAVAGRAGCPLPITSMLASDPELRVRVAAVDRLRDRAGSHPPPTAAG